MNGCDSEVYQATLTDAGKQLLADSKGKHLKLEPGVHYCVKEGFHEDWIAYPEGSVTDTLRHTYIIQKRRRPVAPMFIGSPVPLKGCDSERSAT